MKNAFLKTGVALILALLLSSAYLFTPQVFFSLDNRLRDFMFIIRGDLPKNDRVVIIDIDNKSLKEIGQWPWSRDTISELIKNLTEAKAGIIGLDIIFSEVDRSSPHRLSKKFPSITQVLPNNDKILAETFSTSPVVGGYIFTSAKTPETHTPLIPAIFVQKGLRNNDYLTNQKGIVLNIPILQNALYSSGFFVSTPDNDGIIRRVPLIAKYKDDIYTSLAFEMVRIYSQSNKVEIIGDIDGVQSIKFGSYTVPTESSGEMIVNYRGAQKHFPYISASDILSGQFNPKDIENKFVLLGTSAPGLKDLRSTPFDATFPGVEVHANVIDNLLQKDFLQKPIIARLYDLGIIWGIVFSLMFIFSFLRSWLVLPISVLIFALMLFILYTLLFNYGMVLTLLFPLMAFISTLISSIGIDYFLVSKQKEQAKRILGKKVSPLVMKHLLEHSHEGLIESRETEATVFFSDIRDFTSISEQIGSPKRLIEMLNLYMTPMSDTIMTYKGTIDKFIGDAIMAYWNAPVPVENHADKALQSAIKQINSLKKINQKIHKVYDVHIDIGIGLHTGLVTAGDMGSEGRSDYTIIGDNVNFTSRLEGLTKQYGAQILISNATRKRLQGSYNIRPIDIVEVKGKSEPVEIFEVLCDNKKVDKTEMLLYKQAITVFRDADIKRAHDMFVQLQMSHPCKLYAMYQARCKTFINNPQRNFTPILQMTHK